MTKICTPKRTKPEKGRYRSGGCIYGTLSLYIYIYICNCYRVHSVAFFTCQYYHHPPEFLSSVFISTLLMLTIVVGFVVIVDHASTRLLDFRQVSGGYATEEPAPAVAGA